MRGMDERTLDRLQSVIDDAQLYWEVQCTRCDYRQACWLEDEARIRGTVHEHECDLVTVMLRSDSPQELGHYVDADDQEDI